MSKDEASFEGFPREMTGFMLDLRFNNNKTFMSGHKQRYIEYMREPYYALVKALTPLMLQIDPRMEVRPHKVLSRIYRDTRFTNDKAPYRDHHWIAFRREAEPRESAVLFWCEVRIEGIRWGLGFWGENRPAMDLLRKRMVSHPDDLQTLLPGLKRARLHIMGDSYKRMAVPGALPSELAELYPLKELYIMPGSVPSELAYTPKMLPRLKRDYAAMAPFYRLLRGYHEIAAIEGLTDD